MADEMHAHQMTHRYEPGDDSQDAPGGTVTSTVDFEHAHPEGSAPHHHARADAPEVPEPEPEVKPLIPLWITK